MLVKPQFEVGREHVGKGGIVRDEVAQLAAVEKVRDRAAKPAASRRPIRSNRPSSVPKAIASSCSMASFEPFVSCVPLW